MQGRASLGIEVCRLLVGGGFEAPDGSGTPRHRVNAALFLEGENSDDVCRHALPSRGMGAAVAHPSRQRGVLHDFGASSPLGSVELESLHLARNIGNVEVCKGCAVQDNVFGQIIEAASVQKQRGFAVGGDFNGPCIK